ncbi:MAG: HIT domain-containing protein, partial [Pyrinomonadaceae bacterium]
MSPVKESACVFCAIRDARQNGIDDGETLVLFRGAQNLIVLNIYPYISGHLLIVPYQHVDELDVLEKVASDEMMDLAKTCQTALRKAYNPHGYNVGMNLGSAAGAGIAGHIHLHIMPRWVGDANFITTVGETRT